MSAGIAANIDRVWIAFLGAYYHRNVVGHSLPIISQNICQNVPHSDGDALGAKGPARQRSPV